MTKVAAPVAETWLYAGRRRGADGKAMTAWSTPSGKLVYFGKDRSARLAIGHAYTVDVTRDGDRLTRHGDPRFVPAGEAERAATDDERHEWRAEDAAFSHLLEAERLEKAAGVDDELEQALDVLRSYMEQLTNYQRQSAFLDWVRGEILRGPRSERRP